MPRKSILNLTAEEKKTLRRKRLSQKKLEEYSANQIAEVLEIPTSRAREIVFGDFGQQSPLGMPASWLTMQRQIDQSLRPMRSLGLAMAREMESIVKPFTASGMAQMLAKMNQDIVIAGTASKHFQDSILLSKSFEKLRVNDWIGKAAITGLTHPGLGNVIAQMTSMNSLSQKLLGGFAWESLGSKIGASEMAILANSRKFLDFSSSYTSILQSVTDSPDRFKHYPILAKMPAVEYRTHSTVLEIISNDEPEPVKYDDLILETDECIDKNLPQLGSGYTKMWVGAKQALTSTNPDRVRHFSASVRELMTQLLHKMAPDQQIRQWSTSPDDFANDKPTRRARLNYICRALNDGAYSNFLSKDITAMIGLFDLFQVGTHGVEPDLNDDQLFAIQFRVESTMRFLLEIEFVTNRS
jgi:hypothetical protein